MTRQPRRALRIDDPVAGADLYHTAQPSANGRLRDIALDNIHPNPAQPRKHFEDASLAGLADSIRERGVLQPVIVQPVPVAGTS